MENLLARASSITPGGNGLILDWPTQRSLCRRFTIEFLYRYKEMESRVANIEKVYDQIKQEHAQHKVSHRDSLSPCTWCLHIHLCSFLDNLST